jgi:hypothetical protein
VALSQARILYQNHSGDYPQVILTIPVTCRTQSVLEFLTDLWGLGTKQPSRNRVVVPARQATHSLGEIVPWNRFLGALIKFKNSGLM